MRTMVRVRGWIWVWAAVVGLVVGRQYEVKLTDGVGVEDVEELLGVDLHAVGRRWFVVGGKQAEAHIHGLDWIPVRFFSDSRVRSSKVPERLKELATELAAKSRWWVKDEDRLVLNVGVHTGKEDFVSSSLHRFAKELHRGTGRLDVDVPSRHLERVLQILEEDDLVHWVSRRSARKLLNSYVAAALQAGEESRATDENAVLWKEGLTGANTVIGIADTGIDFDSCYFRSENRKAEINLNSCDFSFRKIACYYSLPGSDASDLYGHGTHVAATAAGLHYKTSASGNPSFQNLVRDNAYYNGAAPGAKILFQDFPTTQGEINPFDLLQMFEQAYRAFARVHSNSWGCASSNQRTICNVYDGEARDVDRFMWDRKDFLIVFAAGNSGTYEKDDGGDYRDGYYTVATPGTSKNALTVGASQTGAPSKSCGSRSCSIQNLASFSSRGNTMDGRVKPEVVAPGERLVSALSSADTDDYKYASQCLTARPRDGTLETSGTSTATPVVSGTATIVRQYYLEFNPLTGQKLTNQTGEGPMPDGLGPSAALVKATVIGAAEALTGSYTVASSSSVLEFNSASDSDKRKLFGFGLPILGNFLNFGSRTLYISDRRQISDGEVHTFRFSANESTDVRVILSYTDYPGSPKDSLDTEPVLVNDLDIEIRCESGCTGQTADSRNEVVEYLNLALTETSRFEIDVKAESISRGPQPYALVVSAPAAVQVDSEPELNFLPDWPEPPRNISGITDVFQSQLSGQKFTYLYGSLTAVGALVVIPIVVGSMFLVLVLKERRVMREVLGDS